MNGYILLSRTITSSDIWNKPPLYLKVWIYLLTEAQYSDYRNLKRGQVKTSIGEIQQACIHYVGARKVTPTYREIRDVIDWLRSPESQSESQHDGQTTVNMIVTTKVTQGFIATICNYDYWQDFSNYESHDENRSKVVRKSSDGQVKRQDKENTNNKYNNTKNKKNIYDDCPPELQKALYDFEEMRKSIKKPMTDKARTLLINQLEKLAGDDTALKVELLEQSILNSWQGVYPLKKQSASAGNKGVSNERLDELLDEWAKGD